ENQSTVKSSFSYKGQLLNLNTRYNNEDTKTINAIKNSDFTVNAIEKVILLINQEKSAAKKLPGSRFFAGAGVNFQSTAFDGNNFDFQNAGKSSSVTPVISAGYDFFANSYTQRLVIRGEIYYSYNKPQFSVPVTYSPTPAQETDTFNQSTVALSPQ